MKVRHTRLIYKSMMWWHDEVTQPPQASRASHRTAHKYQFYRGCGSIHLQTCFHMSELFIQTQNGIQGWNLYKFMCSVLTEFFDHQFSCLWAWNYQKNGLYCVEVTATLNFVTGFGWLSEMGPQRSMKLVAPKDVPDMGWVRGTWQGPLKNYARTQNGSVNTLSARINRQIFNSEWSLICPTNT